MKYMIIFFYLLLSSILYAEDKHKSLACSSQGTEILYINGIANNVDIVEINKDRLNQIILGSPSRIDSKEKVSVDYLYNNSEWFLLDSIQLLEQKFAEEKLTDKNLEIPKLVATYFFNISLLPTRFGPSFIIRTTYELIRIMQARRSEGDLRMMTNRVKDLIAENKKVILVSHSQGGLYANMIYDRLLASGLTEKKINSHVGNVQVASTVKNVKFKNHRVMTFTMDHAINILRSTTPVVNSTYRLLDHESCLFDACHDFRLNYLSSEFRSEGPQQGKGYLTRNNAKIFLDNLEEVAWMLANNDESCCGGRDGRFYRKDYDSKPQEGFLENSVLVGKGVNLRIDNEKTQVCGKVSFEKGEGESSILINQESKVLGDLPMVIKGAVSIQNSEVRSNTQEKTLNIDGTSHENPLMINSSVVAGSADIKGEVVIEGSSIFDSPKISGTSFSPNGATYSAMITNSAISGNSDLKGSYFVNGRNVHNATIEGAYEYVSEDNWNFLAIDSNPVGIYRTVKGLGYIAGNIEYGDVHGERISDNTDGVNIHDNVEVKANLKGALLLDGNTFIQGSWTANILNAGNVPGFATDTNFETIEINGAPAIRNSRFKEGKISGTPYISGSHFHRYVRICGDANVVNQTDDDEEDWGCFTKFMSEIENLNNYYFSMSEIQNRKKRLLDLNLEIQNEGKLAHQ